jgi:hypothetical protein
LVLALLRDGRPGRPPWLNDLRSSTLRAACLPAWLLAQRAVANSSATGSEQIALQPSAPR